MRRAVCLFATIALVLGLSGCAGEDPDVTKARAASIETVTLDRWGDALTDAAGSVLYVFKPDDASTVSCTFTCASNWPPFQATDDELPAAGAGVDGNLISTLPNPSGGKVVTYNGWPLYRYAADRSPGQDKGQGTTLNGGLWYLMGGDGEPIVP